MHHWLCFILLWITISNPAVADIRRWDALPAIDVMHLQGPYTGTEVCPMCKHGYDAGVLLCNVQSRLCVSEKPHALRSDALVALTTADALVPKRIWWARTDNDGCMVLRGMQNPAQLDIEVFSVLQSSSTARLDGKDLQQNLHLEIQLQSSGATEVTGNEVVVGLPCEGCEAVFQGLPTRFSAQSRLASAAEPGAPLLLSGVVTNQSGEVQSGVIVYAYQTDHLGIYPKASGNSTVHGRLRSWVQTDAAGRYAFKTIRPGAYPGTDIAQHIHMHVIEPGRCSYYLGDVLFDDDPRLSEALRVEQGHARGGSGIVEAKETGNKGWSAIRNITLGLDVPGYEACAKK